MRLPVIKVAIAIHALVTFSLFAELAPKPINLGFEEGISGWALSKSPGYDGAVVTEPHSGKFALKLWNTAADPPQFIPASQVIDATPYRGKFIRLRGWVRAEVPQGHNAGQLWLRVDRPGGTGIFDNMMDRPVQSSTWREYEIVGDVADDATAILFGAFFYGNGAMWADDLSLETLDPGVEAHASAKAKRYLNNAIDIIQKNALRSDRVDWPKMRPLALALAGDSTQFSDTYPAILYVLRQLGDHHSFFMPPAQSKSWKEAGASEPKPEVKLLDGEVGYVNVPAYAGGDERAMRAYIDDVESRIASVDKEARCGWIVDLRNNGGGNMWPMLSSLGSIIGEGTLLSMKGPATTSTVVYRKGLAIDRDSAKPEERPDAYKPAQLRPIGVLTSRMTGSSGEAVTIAFRGRPRTRSFGEPTGGVSTANRIFNLEDGAMILLTVSVMIDRNGTEYGERVKPDVETNSDAETLAAAKQWVRDESGCATK